jgi:beta-1,4-N-acetylglucosaminyltransferase
MADPAIAAEQPKHRRLGRTMFVTIGSIASFKDLIKEVLSDKFLEILAELKFTRLIVQCGPDLDFFEETRPQKGFQSHWIDILGFSYTDNMKSYLLKCTPSDGKVDGETRGRGIIVAHAGLTTPLATLARDFITNMPTGAGTVLEALSVNSRLIVVPNTTLMNNHQLELAEELEKQGYLIQGHLGYALDYPLSKVAFVVN